MTYIDLSFVITFLLINYSYGQGFLHPLLKSCCRQVRKEHELEMMQYRSSCFSKAQAAQACVESY